MDLQNRISGFASANGKKFESANSAYKSYINANGEEETPEAKPDFKTFLDTAKKTGVLDNMLKDGASAVKNKINPDTKQEEITPEKKKFNISTTAIVGIVLGVAVIGGIIYFATKKTKSNATT